MSDEGGSAPGVDEVQGETQRERGGRMGRLVGALRSGNFPQGKGWLNQDGQFCCLGVACEVAIAAGVEVEKTLGEERTLGEKKKWRYGSTHTELPGQVAKWFGVSDSNPYLRIPEALMREYPQAVDENGVALADSWAPLRFYAATTLNDAFGFTLAQIADCFELTFLPDDWEATVAAR